ncbi:MAG: DUF421 domain-containing protein [Rhizobiaceae bacterium]|nr:DUF421 domain-containing protein [Rhizobiaceae bacterium]
MLDEGFRILFGEAETATPAFYLEVVFRTLVMYLYTIVLARMVGQGAIGQIGPFEFVLVIAVGSASGDPMLYPEVGLLQGILVITLVILLHRLTGFVFSRNRKLERAVEGLPVLMIENGRIRDKALGSGTVSEAELMSLLRLAGVRDTGEVERAFLETSGKLSVFRYADDPPRAGRSTMPRHTE